MMMESSANATDNHKIPVHSLGSPRLGSMGSYDNAANNFHHLACSYSKPCAHGIVRVATPHHRVFGRRCIIH